VIKLEFLPTHPKPLLAAHAFSKIGAESTNALPETSPIFSLIKYNSSFTFSFTTK
jgi:hypothetical protein